MSAIEIQYIVMNIWFYYPKYSGGQHFCILMCVFVGGGGGGGIYPPILGKEFFYIQIHHASLKLLIWGGGGVRGNLSALTAGQEKTLLNSYNVRFNATTNG